MTVSAAPLLSLNLLDVTNGIVVRYLFVVPLNYSNKVDVSAFYLCRLVLLKMKLPDLRTYIPNNEEEYIEWKFRIWISEDETICTYRCKEKPLLNYLKMLIKKFWSKLVSWKFLKFHKIKWQLWNTFCCKLAMSPNVLFIKIICYLFWMSFSNFTASTHMIYNKVQWTKTENF